MGRTLPTSIQSLRAELQGWRHYRRALRKEDQEAFDALWRYALFQAAPASMASRPMPMEAALMSMLVALQKQIKQIEKNGSPLEVNKESESGQRLDL